MTYFSRVLINTQSWRARRALASRERLHAIIARAVSDASPVRPAVSDMPPSFGERKGEGGHLWRLDSGHGSHGACLYIVSSIVPDSGILLDQLGSSARDVATSEYEPFLERLSLGQEWGFRLCANPTQSHRSDTPGLRGTRTGIVLETDQIAWLDRQGRRCGFHMTINRMDAPEVVIRESRIISFARQRSTVTLSSVAYDGILAIDDPESLRHALLTGIGRGKRYGFGLLTLVPIPGRTFPDEVPRA